MQNGRGDFVSATSVKIENGTKYEIIPLGPYFTTEKLSLHTRSTEQHF